MPQRFKIYVTEYLSESGPEKKILDDIADLTLLQTIDEADVIRRASDADALLVYHDMKLTERSLSALPKVRGVIRCGVGFDNIDLDAAGKRGILVCNVPDYGTEEV